MSSPLSARLETEHGVIYASPMNEFFEDLKDRPLPSYAEMIDAIAVECCIRDVRQRSEDIFSQALERKRLGDLKEDALPVDNVAVIMRYCANDIPPTFHREVALRCYNPDRCAISPIRPFIWSLVKSMEMLPPYPGRSVSRGVKADVRNEYPQGREFTWHGPVSTTKSMEVLANESFLGKFGKRTIFHIDLTQTQARDVSAYSLAEEGEVLLPPGCKFRVTSVIELGIDEDPLTIVRLRELPSMDLILDLGSGLRHEERVCPSNSLPSAVPDLASWPRLTLPSKTTSRFEGVWEARCDHGCTGSGTWTINAREIVYKDVKVSTATIRDRWESLDMLTCRLAVNSSQGYCVYDVTLTPAGDEMLDGQQVAADYLGGSVQKFRLHRK